MTPNRPLSILVLCCAPLIAAAAPETYTIDQDHTFPRFSYNHLGFTTQLSRFNKTSGTIVYDKAARTGSVDIVIDLRSVDTGSPKFDEEIQKAEFFDTAKYPTASFRSTRVIFDGDRPTAVEGSLTLKGVTRPVTLTISSFQALPHPILKKEALGANAWTVVRRSDFNTDKYVPLVSDDVRIDIAVEAVRR